MEIFLKFIEITGNYVPDWVALIVFPALICVLVVIFTVFGGRKGYVPCAVALGGAGFFLVCCARDITVAFEYAAIFGALSGLLALLFLIPCPFAKKKGSREEKRKARDEAIYAQFREELPLPADENGAESEVPLATAEECGTCLSHVTGLLVKLKREKLSPADRLETEALARTVEGYRGKALSEKDLRLINDCLATVLKLTAKYKL